MVDGHVVHGRGDAGHQLAVVVRAAGRKDDLIRADSEVAARRSRLDADRLAVLHDDLVRRGVQNDGHAFFSQVRGKRIDYARAKTGTAEQRVAVTTGRVLLGHRALHAQLLRIIIHSLAGLTEQILDKVIIRLMAGGRVGGAHPIHRIRQIDGHVILLAKFIGGRRRVSACGKQQAAADIRHLFNQNDLCALVRRLGSRRQTGGTRADYDDLRRQILHRRDRLIDRHGTQRIDVRARLLRRIRDRRENGVAGQRCTRNAVHIQRLIGEDIFRNLLLRQVGNARRFGIFKHVDALDLVRAEGDFHADVAVATVRRAGIGAGGVGDLHVRVIDRAARDRVLHDRKHRVAGDRRARDAVHIRVALFQNRGDQRLDRRAADGRRFAVRRDRQGDDLARIIQTDFRRHVAAKAARRAGIAALRKSGIAHQQRASQKQAYLFCLHDETLRNGAHPAECALCERASRLTTV